MQGPIACQTTLSRISSFESLKALCKLSLERRWQLPAAKGPTPAAFGARSHVPGHVRAFDQPAAGHTSLPIDIMSAPKRSSCIRARYDHVMTLRPRCQQTRWFIPTRRPITSWSLSPSRLRKGLSRQTTDFWDRSHVTAVRPANSPRTTMSKWSLLLQAVTR